MNDVKKANELFRGGDLEGALFAYKEVGKKTKQLESIVKVNIGLLEKRIEQKKQTEDEHKNEFNNLEKSIDGVTGKARTSKIAVVFHVYHQNIIAEILEYLRNIEYDFDLYITTPLPRNSEAIESIYRTFPSCFYLHAINRGRDILPFLNVYHKIAEYELCLKIHTKQGLTNFGDLWREVSLQCLLKNKKFVSEIISKFENDQDIAIAGPKDFYLSGRKLIHGNHQNLTNICAEIGISYKEQKEWGFFAGTMFWFRPQVFEKYAAQLKNQKFEKESGRQDGGVEHSIERIFGLIPSYQSKKALLLSGYDGESRVELVSLPDKVGNEDPTKYLATQSKEKLQKLLIRGDVNKQSAGALADLKVRGWLAKVDDVLPREYVVRIGGQEFEGTACIYRSDLEDAKIHGGCHAFEVNVPLKYADGREHTVGLFDKKSGLPVANNKYKWNAIKRPYSNFTEYLAWSYSGQYVSIPFVEEDKRAFSIMELIANELTNIAVTIKLAPLVSIVMPTYNRSSLIGRAINSVISQLYQNWELIIIEDGGSDNTEEVVQTFSDIRIKFQRLGQNAGVSSARNHALKLAKGVYIAYLDSDNDWDCRYLAAMIGAAETKLKSAKAFYSGQLVYGGKSRELTGVRFGMYNQSLLMNTNFIDLNCFMHERVLTNGVPIFSEELRRYVDWDFIIRIAKIDKIASIPVLLSNYYLDVSVNSLTTNDSLTKNIDVVRSNIDSFRASRLDFISTPEGLFNGISIVIPSYNARVDVERCIDSITPYLNIEKGKQVELIIVDNNSGDDVLNYLRRVQSNRSRSVKLIELDRNYGFTYAVNCGIKAAKTGNDVLLLNNDALLTGDCLYKLQKALYANDGFGLSVPAQVLPGGTETICAHVPYALPEYDVDVNVSAHHRNLSNPPLYYEGGILELDFAPFFCVLIKGETIKLVPELDELNGRHYRSDRTYCEYVRTSFGLKVAYCPDSVVYHGLQKSTAELRKKSTISKEYQQVFLQNTWSESDLDDMKRSLPSWNINF